MNASEFRGKASFVVVALLACMVLIGCGAQSDRPATGSPPTAKPVVDPPDFSLQSLDGETVRLADVLGKKPVVIEFFATWCGPCMRHAPELQKFHDAYVGDELALYAISVDNNIDVVSRWLKKSKMSYTVLHDTDKQVADKYQVKGIPLTIGINRAGKIIYRDHGFPRDLAKFVTQMKEGAPTVSSAKAEESDSDAPKKAPGN